MKGRLPPAEHQLVDELVLTFAERREVPPPEPRDKLRDEAEALLWLLRAAATCALEWGWSEDRFRKLAKVAFRIERGDSLDTWGAP